MGVAGRGYKRLDALLAKRGIAFGPASPGPEGYILDVEADGVLIAGRDDRGAFYGMATLCQMIAPTETKDAVRVLPARIADFPDMPLRSASSHWNLFQGSPKGQKSRLHPFSCATL